MINYFTACGCPSKSTSILRQNAGLEHVIIFLREKKKSVFHILLTSEGSFVIRFLFGRVVEWRNVFSNSFSKPTRTRGAIWMVALTFKGTLLPSPNFSYACSRFKRTWPAVKVLRLNVPSIFIKWPCWTSSLLPWFETDRGPERLCRINKQRS